MVASSTIFANLMACRVFQGVALEMMEHPSFDVDNSRIDAAFANLELEPLPPVLPPEPAEPSTIFNPRPPSHIAYEDIA